MGECVDVFDDAFAEGVDVGVLAATYIDDGFRRVELGSINGVNGGIARFAFGDGVFADVSIQRFTFMFEDGKYWRYLASITRQGLTYRLKFG